MLRLIEYFAKSLKIIGNDTLDYGVCKSLCQYSIVTMYLVQFLGYSASNNGVNLRNFKKKNATIVSKYRSFLMDYFILSHPV